MLSRPPTLPPVPIPPPLPTSGRSQFLSVCRCDTQTLHFQPFFFPAVGSVRLSLPPTITPSLPLHPAGYGAFLNPAGSMFLQALLAMLAGEERCLALSRMATRLNAAVALGCQARGTYEGCKQMPCFVTNLPRDIFPFSAQSEPLPSTDTQGGMEEEEERQKPTAS